MTTMSLCLIPLQDFFLPLAETVRVDRSSTRETSFGLCRVFNHRNHWQSRGFVILRIGTSMFARAFAVHSSVCLGHLHISATQVLNERCAKEHCILGALAGLVLTC